MERSVTASETHFDYVDRHSNQILHVLLNVQHNQILVRAPGKAIMHSEDSPCQVMHLSSLGGLDVMSSVLNNHHCNILSPV